MTWPPSQDLLSEAERNLLDTLRRLPRIHPVVTMFAFDRPPAPSLTASVAALRDSDRGARTAQPLEFTARP